MVDREGGIQEEGEEDEVENRNEAANEINNEQESEHAKENEEDVNFIEEINVRATTSNGSVTKRIQINTNYYYYIAKSTLIVLKKNQFMEI